MSTSRSERGGGKMNFLEERGLTRQFGMTTRGSRSPPWPALMRPPPLSSTTMLFDISRRRRLFVSSSILVTWFCCSKPLVGFLVNHFKLVTLQVYPNRRTDHILIVRFLSISNPFVRTETVMQSLQLSLKRRFEHSRASLINQKKERKIQTCLPKVL